MVYDCEFLQNAFEDNQITKSPNHQINKLTN